MATVGANVHNNTDEVLVGGVCRCGDVWRQIRGGLLGMNSVMMRTPPSGASQQKPRKRTMRGWERMCINLASSRKASSFVTVRLLFNATFSLRIEPT
ncbi:unnamed protein product [Taenia asiatica]|uniref:Uncharacterized protein n=1 Tax=Taenia asiatica TaxID=60517 RepID=A0A0R3WFV9_TAEAS|nr:unnamed protein product [Taenia asiatica]